MSWGEGYDIGQKGMLQAIATAENLATKRERDRIIEIIKPFAQCDECEAGGKSDDCSPKLAQYIIALIKGENKHTHEIEVFGAPCLGGDYHEYCLKCGWVEPCEIDGENN